MSAPVVSVIMATYNGAALVGETLATLFAQTMRDFEIIVVDDCSQDETRDVLRAIRDPRLKVIESTVNEGPVCARNRAFAEARGRYVAALDQDDLCLPQRLAEQADYLDRHADVVLVGSQTMVLEDGVLAPSASPVVTTPMFIEWLLWIKNPLVWSSVMLRADAARRLPVFTRPALRYAEDFDLYHRLAPLGRIARIDAPLLTYRSHGGGASQRYTATMEQSAARVLQEAHADRLGNGAAEAAGLLVRHVMRRQPVLDRATLQQLGDVIVALQHRFIADRCRGDEDLRLIRWETARLWSRIGRSSLRAGSLGLGDAMSVRPDHLGLGYASINELVLSRIIGGARGARRRTA